MNDMDLRLVLNGIEQLQRGQQQLVEGQAHVIDRIDHLDECIDSTKQQVAELRRTADDRYTNLVELIKSMVPDGNFEGHRLAHQKMMLDAQRWGEVKGAALKKAVEWAVVGALVLTVTAIWEYIKRGV